MKLIRNVCAASLLAAVSVAGCSSQHGTVGTGTGNGTGPIVSTGGATGEGTGAVGMHLTIAPGVQFQQLTYTITGGATPYSGNVTIGDAQSIEFVVPGLPAGPTYTITITGTDSNGDPCIGSATFTITAGATSNATVIVTCTAPADASLNADVTTGNIAIDAGVVYTTTGAYQCPGISGLSASPAEVLPPQFAQLGVQTTGSSGGTPTYQWTSTGAGSSFSAPNAASTEFLCGTFQGTAQVTVTIGLTGTGYAPDGAVISTGDVCASSPYQTETINVVCENGALTCNFAGQTLCPAVGSNPAYCAYEQTDSNNCGGCGTVCAAPTTCNSGSCSCATAGDVVCSGACVNTQTSTTNCGACGTVCPSGDTCTAGSCVVIPVAVGPCVSSPCATAPGPNFIQCNQNTSGICTGTEAVIVQRDIDKGLATQSSNVPQAGSCYECLTKTSNQCLDSTVHNFTSFECEDLSGTVGSLTLTQACLNTLNCIIGSPQAGTPGTGGTAATLALPDCSLNSSDGVANCYCGSQEPDTNDCSSSPNSFGAGVTTGGAGTASPNGTCAATILTDLGLTTSASNATVITDLGNTANGPGQAFNILECAGTNQGAPACPQCFQ